MKATISSNRPIRCWRLGEVSARSGLPCSLSNETPDSALGFVGFRNSLWLLDFLLGKLTGGAATGDKPLSPRPAHRDRPEPSSAVHRRGGASTGRLPPLIMSRVKSLFFLDGGQGGTMAAEWFYQAKGQQFGPILSAELRRPAEILKRWRVRGLVPQGSPLPRRRCCCPAGEYPRTACTIRSLLHGPKTNTSPNAREP